MKIKKSSTARNSILLKLAVKAVSQIQADILAKAKESEGLNVSLFVDKVKNQLNCSDSNIWKNIKKLRETNLLKDSNIIEPTNIGNIILEAKNGK